MDGFVSQLMVRSYGENGKSVLALSIGRYEVAI